MNNSPAVYFTIDIDWAPEAVIADTLALLEENQVAATLFCTHKSRVIDQCNTALFEKAIHPNFNFLLNGQKTNGESAEAVLDHLLHLYPQATGVRSHSMTQSSVLLDLFLQKGLLYDANHFLPYQQVRPFKLWNGLVRIPYNWEDDVHFFYGKEFEEPLFSSIPGDLLIVDFHPVHIYLNTKSKEHYQEAKKYYQQPDELIKCRGSSEEKAGVRDVFIQLLLQNKGNKNTMHQLALINQ
jgi:hypothetical protein